MITTSRSVMTWAILLWIACAPFTYGIAYAFFQKKFPTIADESYRTDAGMALLLAVFGPVSLVIMFLFTGFAETGMKFRIRRPE